MRLKCQLALICALAASRFTVMLRALAEVNRLFLVRLRWFLSTICNPDKPTPLFGQVLYYISRIEFQSRGSSHAHIVIWIADRATASTQKSQLTSRLASSKIQSAAGALLPIAAFSVPPVLRAHNSCGPAAQVLSRSRQSGVAMHEPQLQSGRLLHRGLCLQAVLPEAQLRRSLH